MEVLIGIRGNLHCKSKFAIHLKTLLSLNFDYINKVETEVVCKYDGQEDALAEFHKIN